MYTISIIRVKGKKEELIFKTEKAYENRLRKLTDAMAERKGNYPYIVRSWKFGELDHEYQA